MQIVPVGQTFDAEIRDIESRTHRCAPVAMNPRSINANSKVCGKQAKERPVKPVIDNISALAAGDCFGTRCRERPDGRGD